MTAAQLIEKAKAYYRKPGNSVGGNLHIVLDDGNIKNSHIQYCIERCIESGDIDGIELGNLLLAASMTQRNKVARANLYTTSVSEPAKQSHP